MNFESLESLEACKILRQDMKCKELYACSKVCTKHARPARKACRKPWRHGLSLICHHVVDKQLKNCALHQARNLNDLCLSHKLPEEQRLSIEVNMKRLCKEATFLPMRPIPKAAPTGITEAMVS